MVDENDIPFPLLSGQYFSVLNDGGNTRAFYKVTRQPTMYDFAYPYEIAPSESLADQDITIGSGSGALSIWRTKANELKQWVTWIDNDYLGVIWNVVDVKINSMTGTSEPETKYLCPFGSVNFPKFIFNNAAGNVTFTLKNLSTTKTIAGTLHIIMYGYTSEPANVQPQYYTDIEYKGTTAGVA